MGREGLTWLRGHTGGVQQRAHSHRPEPPFPGQACEKGALLTPGPSASLG